MEKQQNTLTEEIKSKDTNPENSKKKDTKAGTSSVDPARDTVGKIYVDAAKNNTDPFVEAGDLTNELMKSLVDDLNDNIKSDPFNGRAFYVTVIERKDLLMPRAINRELRNTLYRPWPEDDTVVFRVFPNSNVIKFCWCLPHHTEMDNILLNKHLYNSQMVNDIKAFKDFDLLHFGFVKNNEDKWQAYPNHQDRVMVK